MTSLMLEEALSAAAVASRQLAVLDACLPALGQRLREVDPNLALTVARGSSDHAASYFAYLAMQHAGLPVASLPMSVVTLNRSPLRVAGQAVFAFSQSGQSPDLVDSLRILRERGALGIALVNAEDSPLEAASEFVVPLCAGTERSVAATKSFIATLSASARLLSRRPSGLRKTTVQSNSLAHRTTWLRSDLFVVPLCAGTERSVAATKSFIATLSASARLL
ncbi:SIS domain-containing protein, partial [Pseudomonas aeruginosa]|uniref:SIS domain-containing protein n=1 Tax=Pseudomonas aeruginosa TaxID=287 RepID=UPI0023B16A9B